MEKQEKINRNSILNRCYINWNCKNKKTKWEETPIVMVFPKNNREIPYSQQTPEFIGTIEETEKQYNERIKENGMSKL